jgi:hypothetical protein
MYIYRYINTYRSYIYMCVCLCVYVHTHTYFIRGRSQRAAVNGTYEEEVYLHFQ